jgi:uncharacterized protein with NRDE domain
VPRRHRVRGSSTVSGGRRANRDEYHARPAAPAAWWDEGFLAGRDLKAGGTWLGVDRRGRFALLTNVREPARHNPDAPSRGSLVPNILTAEAPPSVSLPAQVRAGAAHNGFNLIAGDLNELLWGSNRADAPRTLGSGIYAISNHLLDTPWPKVTRTKEAFRRGAKETTAARISKRSSRCCTTRSTRETPSCRPPASRWSGSGCCRRRSS